MTSDARSDHPSLDPDVVAGQTFASAFRGYDTGEVRGYLEVVASLLRDAAAREEALTRRLSEAEEQLATPPVLDEHQLTALLGEETTRVIETARQAAVEIRARSEENAARLVREANEEATATRSSADEYASRLRTEAAEATAAQRSSADEYASRIRTEADADAAQLRADAEADATRMRDEAESLLSIRTAEADAAAAAIRSEAEDLRTTVAAEVESLRSAADTEIDERHAATAAEVEAALEAARQEGRAMVAEARAVRERMLTDLADRRRTGRLQLDQLKATRQHLSDVVTSARNRLDEASAELAAWLPEARPEAEEALRQDRNDDALLAEMIADQPADQAGPPAAPPEPADTPVAVAAEAASPQAETDPEPAATAIHGAPDAAPRSGEQAGASGAPDPPTDEHVDDGQHDLAVDVTAEPATVAPDVTEPVAAPAAAAPGADAPAAVAPDDEPTEPAEAAEAADQADIDALFAKIRASRAGDVEHADRVLGDVDRAADADAHADAGTDAGGGTRTEAAPSAGDADEISLVDDPVEPEPPDFRSTLLERRDAATDQIEHQLARRLKRLLSDEQNELLDQVRRAKGVPSLDTTLPDAAAHAGRYADAASDDLAGAAAAGATFYGDAPAGLTTKVDDLADRLADELVRQLRARIGRSFSEAEGDEAELDERIRACYREWKTQRIADTSRHFVLAAFTRGLFDAAPSATAFQWIVDDGGTPCPDAEDNALQGDVAKGDPFPTGDAYPPAHPGCRCLIVPVSPTEPEVPRRAG